MIATTDRGVIGRTGVRLSRLCLGTMRLGNAGDVAAAAALIRHAYERGITSFHCSSEYDTFRLFADAWREAGFARPDGVSIIAKLAAPHFGEDRFSTSAFREKLDMYLEVLGLDRLDVVQWLLRHDLKREDERLAIIEKQGPEISELVAQLKQEGKIGAFVAFPYTAPVAAAALGADYCDGLALYVNPLEREMDRFVFAAGEAGKSVVAIRPFAAGRLFSETSLQVGNALDHAFGFAAVATVVVSASSPQHVDELTRHVPGAA